MFNYIFYPGCSTESSARPYLDSLLVICEALGITLDELPDWNCCGATEYFTINILPAYALIARNLALAARQANSSRTIVAPCSACYLNLAKTDHYMRESPALNKKVNAALAAGGLQYTPGSVAVRHLLDVLLNDVGLEAIQRKVVRPLTGLRVAPYYGCLIPRPDYDQRCEDYEYPTGLDRLLEALGAEVIDFPLKTYCCGGHMTQISAATAYELIRRLIHSAAEASADIIATLCPMCQLNLDAYQVEMNKFFKTSYHVPVVFFTQLMGVAFGKEAAALGLGKEFVDARPALAKIGMAAPTEPLPHKPRAPKEALPMPRMPGPKEEVRR